MTDNSPALGGQAQDNSPMLGGDKKVVLRVRQAHVSQTILGCYVCGTKSLYDVTPEIEYALDSVRGGILLCRECYESAGNLSALRVGILEDISAP